MAVYKKNSLLSLFPDYDVEEPAFTLEHPVESRKFSVSDVELLTLLTYADDWTERGDLVDFAVEQFDVIADEARELVDQFIEYEFLIPKDSEVADVERRADSWRGAGWDEALDYYLYVRDLAFVPDVEDVEDVETWLTYDQQKMEEYAISDDIPPVYEEYEDAETIPLPEVDEERAVHAFDETVVTPSGSDVPDVRPDREELSEILYYPFGQTGMADFGHPQGEKLLKTVPSGGARHPTEAYLAVLDVEAVPEGLYHYSVKEHGLDVIDRGESARAAVDTVYDLEFSPSFVVFYSSVVGRSMWRYREPRTYRVLFHDVGHAVETLDMLATSHGRPAQFGFNFDEQASTLLGLDQYEEPLLGYSAVG